MQTAHKRDAVNQEKFYFRKNITGGIIIIIINDYYSILMVFMFTEAAEKAEYTQMTINEIMNGNGEFKGIIPLMTVYLASANVEAPIKQAITKYQNQLFTFYSLFDIIIIIC